MIVWLLHLEAASLLDKNSRYGKIVYNEIFDNYSISFWNMNQLIFVDGIYWYICIE